jgi:hypothetical protein
VKNLSNSRRLALRPLTRESTNVATATTGPRAANTNAKVEPVINQIATAMTTGAIDATNGKRNGGGRSGTRGDAIRLGSPIKVTMKAQHESGSYSVNQGRAVHSSPRWARLRGRSAHDEELLANVDTGATSDSVAFASIASLRCGIRLTHDCSIPRKSITYPEGAGILAKLEVRL